MSKIRLVAGLAAALAGGIWIGSALSADHGIEGWQTLNTEMASRLSASAASDAAVPPASAPAAGEIAAKSGKADTGAQGGQAEGKAISPGAVTDAGLAAVAGTQAGANGGAEAGTSAAADGRVNVNTAGLAELTELTGIGEKKARAIVEERNQGGPFKNLEDLGRVKGIGPKMLEKLRTAVTF